MIVTSVLHQQCYEIYESFTFNSLLLIIKEPPFYVFYKIAIFVYFFVCIFVKNFYIAYFNVVNKKYQRLRM